MPTLQNIYFNNHCRIPFKVTDTRTNRVWEVYEYTDRIFQLSHQKDGSTFKTMGTVFTAWSYYHDPVDYDYKQDEIKYVPPCTCASWDLFHFGCRCGSFKAEKALKKEKDTSDKGDDDGA